MIYSECCKDSVGRRTLENFLVPRHINSWWAVFCTDYLSRVLYGSGYLKERLIKAGELLRRTVVWWLLAFKLSRKRRPQTPTESSQFPVSDDQLDRRGPRWREFRGRSRSERSIPTWSMEAEQKPLWEARSRGFKGVLFGGFWVLKGFQKAFLCNPWMKMNNFLLAKINIEFWAVGLVLLQSISSHLQIRRAQTKLVACWLWVTIKRLFCEVVELPFDVKPLS